MTGKNYLEDTSQIRLRDEILLKELVAGASTFRHLHEKLHAYFASESAFRQRLAQLARSSYIESKLYVDNGNSSKFALYVLQSAGIEYLCNEKKYAADEIRTLLPSQHTIAHELTVTEVVRRLRRESLQIPYNLKYYDDPACRNHKKLLGLKSPIPDLLIDLKLNTGHQTYRILTEIHMGTVPVLEVVDKTLKQEHQTLFVVNTRENMDDLLGPMRDHPQFRGRVYFTLISEFCASPGGIFGSNYTSLDGRCVSLYP